MLARWMGPDDFSVVNASVDARVGGAHHIEMIDAEGGLHTPGELPGMSAFVQRDGVVYHTYSAYARGLDAMWGMYQWLDRAPLGRNEADSPGWMRRHDAYEDVSA